MGKSLIVASEELISRRGSDSGTQAEAGEGFLVDFVEGVYGHSGFAGGDHGRAAFADGVGEVLGEDLMASEADGHGVGVAADNFIRLYDLTHPVFPIDSKLCDRGVIEGGGAAGAE